MKRILIYELEKLFSCSVAVEKSKRQGHGDYSSNVVLKNKLTPTDLLKLEKIAVLEGYELLNGHLNLTVKEDLLSVDLGNEKRRFNHRMVDVFNRLRSEGYGISYDSVNLIDSKWMPLVKTYNLLLFTQEQMGSVRLKEVDELIQVFNSIDSTYIYRNDNEHLLSMLSELFGKCIYLLERVVYEEHI